MMPMTPHSPEQDLNRADLFDIPPVNMDRLSADAQALSYGARLRAAREARGLDLASCAHALKLPLNVLRQLERDAYDGIDSKIYLGSYITKYGQYLGINEASIQVERDRIRQIELPLVATGGISHSRFLLDRYATAATYVVLTAVIVVPMIWLGVRGTLDRDLSHLAPLDAAPVAMQDVPTAGSSVALAHLPSTPASLPPAQEPQPLLASMAPFPGMDSATLSPPPKPDAAATVGTGSHSFSLDLSSASWVEVTDQKGSRLEYGLLPAGSDKTYRSDQPLDVRIGNASGAQIRIDGTSVGLDEFRRANVAHFRVQVQDGKAAATAL